MMPETIYRMFMISPHQVVGDPCQSQSRQEERDNEGQKEQITHTAPPSTRLSPILAAHGSKRSQENGLACQENVKRSSATRRQTENRPMGFATNEARETPPTWILPPRAPSRSTHRRLWQRPPSFAA